MVNGKAAKHCVAEVAKTFGDLAAKHYVAEVAKTFGDATSTAETLGEFRYDKRLRRPLPL